MIRRLMPTVVVTEGPSQGWGDLFDVRPLLRGPWMGLPAMVAWETMLSPTLEGRRVVLSGRTIEATDYHPLPPMRWLQLGREGEPAEVMWLPGSVDAWRNEPRNRALVDEWMAEEMQRREKIARAWVNIPGTGLAYHFARGMFGLREGTGVAWWTTPGDLGQRTKIVHAVQTKNAGRLNRFGGGGWDNLRHSLLVRAALPANASPVRKRKALTHDHHETLVADLSSPLKGLISLDWGGGLWRECDHVADAAVERLFGIDGLTDEDRQAVKVADQAALRIEGRALGIDLGDPAEVHTHPGSLEMVHRALATTPDVEAAWWSMWHADGGA